MWKRNFSIIKIFLGRLHVAITRKEEKKFTKIYKCSRREGAGIAFLLALLLVLFLLLVLPLLLVLILLFLKQVVIDAHAV